MDIRQLSDEILRFVESRGWFNIGSPRPPTPRNLAMSVSIESAEVLEHFQWDDNIDRVKLGGEMADVLIYLVELAAVTGIDLERATLDKIKANHNRNI